MTDLKALQNQIRNVARARQEAQRLTDEKAAKLKAWEDENQIFLEAVKGAGEYRNEQEYLLREITLQAYEETKNKAPAQGVSIKIFRSLKYDPVEAKTWCLEHKVALALDIKTFEKLAQVERLPFVTITEEPKAQIAANLDLTNIL